MTAAKRLPSTPSRALGYSNFLTINPNFYAGSGSGPPSGSTPAVGVGGYHQPQFVPPQQQGQPANQQPSLYPHCSFLPFYDKAKVFADPLVWWKEKQFHFPILSKLARKYLCIPATEAPSERIFSTASLLLSKYRNRMDPELAGRMVFIKKNFEWYEELLQKASEEE
jgi:hypothetical protein